MVDLAAVSTDVLLAEVARRCNADAPKKPRAKKLQYATKAEWARAKQVEAQKLYADIEVRPAPTDSEWRQRQSALDAQQQEIDKYGRMAASYERKGE